MQQPGSSQDKVLNEFKEDTNSVLLGTGAYWEGISIEGKSLSNVIIFRLPFPVPDPIIEYKCSVAKDALMDVRVPEDCGMSRRNAIMTLHGTPCLSKIGQAVWANLGSFTKVCPQPRNDDTNGSLFGNIEQPPKKRQSENGGVSCCTMKICTKKNNI